MSAAARERAALSLTAAFTRREALRSPVALSLFACSQTSRPPHPSVSLPLGGIMRGPWARGENSCSKPMPLGASAPGLAGGGRRAAWGLGVRSSRLPAPAKPGRRDKCSRNSWAERTDCLRLPAGRGLRHSCRGLASARSPLLTPGPAGSPVGWSDAAVAGRV